MSVGVYYASNAVGRLTGTLLSGVLYTYAGSSVVTGMGTCLLASTAFSLASMAVDFWLTEDAPGASWLSPFNRCLPARYIPSHASGAQRAEGGQEAGGGLVPGAAGAEVGAAEEVQLDAPPLQGVAAARC